LREFPEPVQDHIGYRGDTCRAVYTVRLAKAV
jgi:hypothetical protein